MASSRSATDAVGQPAVERPDGVVGRVQRRVTSSAPGVEQPGVAQRLEGVEEGDPAAQRHQHRASSTPRSGRVIDQRSTKPSSPAQAASWSALLRQTVEQPRRRRPRSRPTASAALGAGRQPGDDQLAQRDVEGRRAVDGRAGPAQPAAPAASSRSGVGNGFQPAGTARPGDRSAARRRSPAPRSAPATAPRPAPGTSFGLTVAPGRRYGASRSRTAISRPLAAEPGRRRRGLRGHVDLGQRQVAARSGVQTSRPGWRNAVNAAISPSDRATSPPSRAR